MVRSVLPIAVLVLVLGGCTTKDSGNPTAGGSTTTPAETSVEATTTTTAAADNELAGFDPCEELNEVSSQLSLSRIADDGKQDCTARWGESTTAVRIKVFPDLGIDEVKGSSNSKSSDISIGAHKAKQVTATASDLSCAVAVEITAESRVDFIGSTNTTVDEACAVATKLAEAVEPKLPE